MKIRHYKKDKDRKACHRIWTECAWVESKEDKKAMDTFVSDGRNLVAEVGGQAECLACAKQGNLNYLGHSLNFSAVMAVTTSRIARKQGLASRLTAQLIAEEAAAGAHISGLGIFDSGYYDQLGYGLGSYETIRYFDPAQLKVSVKHRTPTRLTTKDFKKIYTSLSSRYRTHGSIMIDSANFFKAELKWTGPSFGLGYPDKSGEGISHFIWCKTKGESGPYRITFMAWQNSEQYFELLALIKSLSDQVISIGLIEHPEIQLQQLLDKPFRHFDLTYKADKAARSSAQAYWQARICNLEACISACEFEGIPLEFNLKLTDPITKFLDKQAPWQGLEGDYTIMLSTQSSVSPGLKNGLPTLTTDINAFTRLWLGVQTAKGLSITDNFSAPEELILYLDEYFRLPKPSFEIDF